MEFPPAWDIFGGEDFAVAEPRNPGTLGLEVMAQLRHTGRILDHFRMTIGGSAQLKVIVDLAKIIPAATTLPKWRLSYAAWPRDIEIRRNMTTGAWIDVRRTIASNEAVIIDDTNAEVETNTVLDALDAIADRNTCDAAFRWAVCGSEDRRCQLICQSLPASAEVLSGKPTFRG